MKLKHALWATAIWTVFSVIASGLIIWYIGTHPVPGVRSEQRAASAGQGAAVAIVIGYALIWLPYAAKIGKQRRQARQEEQDKKKRNRSRRG